MNNLLKNSLIIGLGISAMSAAYAETTVPAITIPTGWYAGGGLGFGKSSCTDCQSYTGNSSNVNKLILNLVGGYRFNTYIAGEVSLNWLPSIKNVTPQNTTTYGVNATEFAIRGILPLGNQFSAFGKLGAAIVGIGGGLALPTDRGTMGMYYAGGIAYDFSRHLRGTASINYIQADTFGSHFDSLYGLGGVEYVF